MIEILTRDECRLQDIQVMSQAFSKALGGMLPADQCERIKSGTPSEDDLTAASRLGGMFLLAVHWTLLQLAASVQQCEADEAPRILFRRTLELMDEHSKLDADVKADEHMKH